jgi:hypothetical protein
MPYQNGAVLHSGGHKGTESEFGRNAERWGLEEVTYTFDGHRSERDRGLVHLGPAELAKGDVSMEIVSRHMGRTYHSAERIRRVIQSIFHMVVNSHHVLAVGWLLPSGLVKGGTGWGVELAKFFNRPVSVFDQETKAWYTWTDGAWEADSPVLEERPFSATGTRNLTDAGREAIRDLFERSFGAAPE